MVYCDLAPLSSLAMDTVTRHPLATMYPLAMDAVTWHPMPPLAAGTVWLGTPPIFVK